MLSAAVYLLLHGIYMTLRLSDSNGSFPRPLSAGEEHEYIERCMKGDQQARNILIEQISVWSLIL
jgi:RNA polymerase sporulation-specific sigma factor